MKKEDVERAVVQMLGAELSYSIWQARPRNMTFHFWDSVSITLAMFQGIAKLLGSEDIDVTFTRETGPYSDVTPGDGATLDIYVKNVALEIEEE